MNSYIRGNHNTVEAVENADCRPEEETKIQAVVIDAPPAPEHQD